MNKRFSIVILLVVVALLVGGGAYYGYYLSQGEHETETAEPSSVQSQGVSPTQESNPVRIVGKEPFYFRRFGATIIPEINDEINSVTREAIFFNDTAYLYVSTGLLGINEITDEANFYPGPRPLEFGSWTKNGSGDVLFAANSGIWKFNPQTGFELLFTTSNSPLKKNAAEIMFFDQGADTLWLADGNIYMNSFYSYQSEGGFVELGSVVSEQFNLENPVFTSISGNDSKIYVGFRSEASGGGILEFDKSTGSWNLIRSKVSELLCEQGVQCKFNVEYLFANNDYLWASIIDRKIVNTDLGLSYGTHVIRMDVNSKTWKKLSFNVIGHPVSKEELLFRTDNNELYEVEGFDTKRFFSLLEGLRFTGIRNEKVYATDNRALYIYFEKTSKLVKKIELPKTFFEGESNIRLLASDGVDEVLLRTSDTSVNISDIDLKLLNVDTLELTSLNLPSGDSGLYAYANSEFFDGSFFVLSTASKAAGITSANILRYDTEEKKLYNITSPLESGYQLILYEGKLYLTDDYYSNFSKPKNLSWYEWDVVVKAFKPINTPEDTDKILLSPGGKTYIADIINDLTTGLFNNGIKDDDIEKLRKVFEENYPDTALGSRSFTSKILYVENKAIVNFFDSLIILDLFGKPIL